jgi:hypothetical protein
MRDFIVFTKPVKTTGKSEKRFSFDYHQMSLLLQESFKDNPQMSEGMKDFTVDENSIKLEMIDGSLHIVMIAFRKLK